MLENASGAALDGADKHVMLHRSAVWLTGILACLTCVVPLHALAQAPPAGPAQQAPGRAPTQSVQPRVAQQQPAVPQAPFVLSPQEQQQLEQVLINWEKRSQQIETLQCDVHRWERNNVFNTQTYGHGELRYASPDKGLYRIEDGQTGDALDHWICNGQSIFEFKYDNKQLIERPLPPELQGKAIANGPLPFLFGAQADDLKRRYWMRLVPPPQGFETKLSIEAYPKGQQDAANFSRAIFLMDPAAWVPVALLLDMPNGQSQTTHRFENVEVNKVNWFGGDFANPRTPFGWKRIVEEPERLPEQPPAQARQTVPVPERR